MNVFERIKVMIAMPLIHLCFGGDSPLGYVKNKVFLIFFCHNCNMPQTDGRTDDGRTMDESPFCDMSSADIVKQSYKYVNRVAMVVKQGA